MEDWTSELECANGLFPVEMLKMKQRKRGQVPGESIVAGDQEKEETQVLRTGPLKDGDL